MGSCGTPSDLLSPKYYITLSILKELFMYYNNAEYTPNRDVHLISIYDINFINNANI